MERIATRPDGWQLFKAGEQYFESQMELTDEQLDSDGEEILTTTGNLKQLGFNRESLKGWFNGSETEEDFQKVISTLEPLIIEFWKEKKVTSWIMEIY